MLDARMDGDGGSLAKGGNNFGGSAGVNLANHFNEVRVRDAHMREAGGVRDAAKSITDIQPRNTKWTGLPFGIVENRFQQKGMFVATFAGSSTLLFV